jgi:hypothetical protein
MPSNERPLRPSFDVTQYADDPEPDTCPPSAANPCPADAVTQPTAHSKQMAYSEMRLMTRPTMGAAPTDEAWARSVSGMLVVVTPLERLKRLPLNHRAGFLLSRMDGSTDLETVVEIAAMPREEALRILRDLFESGVVDFR